MASDAVTFIRALGFAQVIAQDEPRLVLAAAV
jgi:hypothetical protein